METVTTSRDFFSFTGPCTFYYHNGQFTVSGLAWQSIKVDYLFPLYCPQIRQPITEKENIPERSCHLADNIRHCSLQ